MRVPSTPALQSLHEHRAPHGAPSLLPRSNSRLLLRTCGTISHASKQPSGQPPRPRNIYSQTMMPLLCQLSAAFEQAERLLYHSPHQHLAIQPSFLSVFLGPLLHICFHSERPSTTKYTVLDHSRQNTLYQTDTLPRHNSATQPPNTALPLVYGQSHNHLHSTSSWPNR